MSPDCKSVVVGTKGGDVKVLLMETKQKVQTFPKMHEGKGIKFCVFTNERKEPVTRLLVTPDNNFAITYAWDGLIKVLDIKEGKLAHVFKGVFSGKLL